MTQGIIFDYGGTIDTNAQHWSEVLWAGYEKASIPVGKEEFRQSYVMAERALARHPYIQPHHNFLDLLRIKCDLETRDLAERGFWAVSETERRAKSEEVATWCHAHVLQVLDVSRPIIAELAHRYPLVLVSNFYGNIETILRDFRLMYFSHIVESAVVGIRKPDPRIFQLGVDALRRLTGKTAEELPAKDILVVGDSYSKDIVPAASIGCKTAWLRGVGWAQEEVDESLPTHIMHSIKELPQTLEA